MNTPVDKGEPEEQKWRFLLIIAFWNKYTSLIIQIYPRYEFINPVSKTFTRFAAFDFMANDDGLLER
jgi:hypothetical protein